VQVGHFWIGGAYWAQPWWWGGTSWTWQLANFVEAAWANVFSVSIKVAVEKKRWWRFRTGSKVHSKAFTQLV
jgi:hypothetical protein